MPCSVPAARQKDDYMGGFSSLGNRNAQNLLNMAQGSKKLSPVGRMTKRVHRFCTEEHFCKKKIIIIIIIIGAFNYCAVTFSCLRESCKFLARTLEDEEKRKRKI